MSSYLRCNVVQRLDRTRNAIVLFELIQNLLSCAKESILAVSAIGGRVIMAYRASESHVLVKGTNENILLVFIMMVLMFGLNIDNLRQYGTLFSPFL